jgi:hypothetical protein
MYPIAAMGRGVRRYIKVETNKRSLPQHPGCNTAPGGTLQSTYRQDEPGHSALCSGFPPSVAVDGYAKNSERRSAMAQ